jgi:hypothetical protein
LHSFPFDYILSVSIFSGEAGLMKSQSPIKVVLSAVGFGGIFSLVGAFIIAISLDVIHMDDASFHAPRLVVAAAGLVFFLAGVLVVQQQLAAAFGQDSAWIRWTQYFLLLFILLAFSAVFIWAGLGPGERAFTQSTGLGPVTTSSTGDETTGRFLFGGFGILTLLATLAFAVFKWPSRRQP